MTSLIIQRARKLRKNSTATENLLWSRLRCRRLNGLKFKRNEPIFPFIVDFVCTQASIIVELDGGQHNEEKQKQYDQKRTKYLEKMGYKVLRYWDNEVLTKLDAVLESILLEIEYCKLKKRKKSAEVKKYNKSSN